MCRGWKIKYKALFPGLPCSLGVDGIEVLLIRSTSFETWMWEPSHVWEEPYVVVWSHGCMVLGLLALATASQLSRQLPELSHSPGGPDLWHGFGNHSWSQFLS